VNETSIAPAEKGATISRNPDPSIVTIVTELSRLIVLGKHWKNRNYLWVLHRASCFE
jgi:hypothetical protein